MEIGKRFEKYFFVIALVAIICVLVCMAATDVFWGLLISIGVIPIACLFACGVIATFEVCVQRGAKIVAEKESESLVAEEAVEVLEKR
jgi:F0F1-type ATP synthase assembly protein I